MSDAHICRTCRTVLGRHSLMVGGEVVAEYWEHSELAQDRDPPCMNLDPIPQVGQEVVAFCDFCNAAGVDLVDVQVRTFTARPKGKTDFVSVEGWGACRECMPLVDAENWDELFERYWRNTPKMVTDRKSYAKKLLVQLWQQMSKNRIKEVE